MAANHSPSSSISGDSTIQMRNFPTSRPIDPTPRPQSPQTPRPKYYSIIPSFAEQFHNLDSDTVYSRFKSALVTPTTSNFIVDFGGAPEDGGEAWCALNLDSSDGQTIEGIKKLLHEPVCHHPPPPLRVLGVILTQLAETKKLANSMDVRLPLLTLSWASGANGITFLLVIYSRHIPRRNLCRQLLHTMDSHPATPTS